MSEQKISVLLQGNKGSEIKEEAFRMAKEALCLGDSSEQCRCASCSLKSLNQHPDFQYIYPVEKRSIGVDEIAALLSRSRTIPVMSNRLVTVIDGFDMVTEQAQNKLLKTLEEQLNFFLIGICYSDNVLPTIKSRMHVITKASTSIEVFTEACKKRNLQDIGLLYYMTGGCVDLADEMQKLKPMFYGVLESIQQENYVGILQSLHMVKDKDKESYANVAREYIPQMYSFFIAIFSEWLKNIFQAHVAAAFNFPKCNPETLIQCVDWMKKELISCRTVTYTTASFEVAIFNVIGILLSDTER